MTKVFVATAIRQTGSFPITSDVHLSVSHDGYEWDYKGVLGNVPTADFNYRKNIIRAWSRLYFCPVVISGFTGGSGASIKSLFYSDDNGASWNILDISAHLGTLIIRRIVFSEVLGSIVLVTSGTTVNPSGTLILLDSSHNLTTVSGSISNTVLPILVGTATTPAFWSSRFSSFFYTLGSPTRLDRLKVESSSFTISNTKMLEDDGITLKNFNKPVALDAQSALVSLDFSALTVSFSEDSDLWGFESLGGFYYSVRRNNSSLVRYYKTFSEAESAVLSLDTSNPLDSPHSIQGEFLGGTDVITGVPIAITTVTGLRESISNKDGNVLLNKQYPFVSEGAGTYPNGWRMTSQNLKDWDFEVLTSNTQFKDVYNGPFGGDLKSTSQSSWVISGGMRAFNDTLGYGVWILGKTDGTYIVIKSDDPFAKDAEVLT
jgi:hypothetical protein